MKYLTLFIGVLSLLTSSLTFAQKAQSKQEPTHTLLLVGDSLSSDFSVNTNETWLYYIETNLGQYNPEWKITNYSLPHYTVNHALRMIDYMLKTEKPDAVAIQLGLNDALGAAPVRDIKAKLEKLIAKIHEFNVPIIVIGTSMRPEFGENYVKRYLEMFPELAVENQTALIPDMMTHITVSPTLLENDLVHANKEGHKQILTNVWPELQVFLNCVKNNKVCYVQPPEEESDKKKKKKKKKKR